MLSTYQKLQRVTGLTDNDLTEWERGFVKTLQSRLDAAKGQVVQLSDKQLEALDRLHDKHFA